MPGAASGARGDLPAVTFHKPLGRFKGFSIFQVPYSARIRVPGSRRKVANCLTKTPFRAHLSKFCMSIQQLGPRAIDFHSFSPTVGNSATGIGKSSMTSTITFVPGQKIFLDGECCVKPRNWGPRCEPTALTAGFL